MRKPGKSAANDPFTGYRDRLQNYLRARLDCEADAQELAQEAYLRVLRISTKQLIRHPQAYLYRIAINLVHELYANRLPQQQIVGENSLADIEDPGPLLEEVTERNRQLQQVERALSELPPKCRAVVTLRSRQGMTNKEVADQLGLSVHMVKKYMSKGVAHCRKRLRRFREEEGR